MSNYNCWCDNDERRRLTTMLTAHRCLLHAMNFYYCCFFKIGKKNIGLEMTNNFKIEDRLSKVKSSLKSICVNIWFKWSSLVPINGFVCIDSGIQNKTLNLISFLRRQIICCISSIFAAMKFVILSTHFSFYNTKVVVKFVNVPN